LICWHKEGQKGMIILTDEQAENVMEFLFAAYPYVVEKTSGLTLNLYLAYIKTMPFEFGRAAVIKIIENSKYFPTIAEIKEAAQSFVQPKHEIPTAEMAWEEVRKKLDPYKAQIWSHPLVERTVKTIGARNLCHSTNPGVDMAHFMRIYDSYRKREIDAIQNESIIKITASIVKSLPISGDLIVS